MLIFINQSSLESEYAYCQNRIKGGVSAATQLNPNAEEKDDFWPLFS